MHQIQSRKDGLLMLIPYSSLAAFFMFFFGVVLFFLMIFWAFNASVEQIRRTFPEFEIVNSDQVHLLFLFSASFMLVLALFLLILGILSTGLTRAYIYKQEKARRNGKVVLSVGLFISYLLLFVWIFITCAMSILSFVYVIFSSLCSSVSSENSCLDFNFFKKLFRFKNENLILCRGALEQFCAISNTVTIWCLLGLGGCLIICFGLLIFITAGVANYVHINAEAKNSKFREIVQSEVGDFLHPSQSLADVVLRERTTRSKDKLSNVMWNVHSSHNNLL